MTRLRGRAARGERGPGSTPRGHWQIATILGAIRPSGIAAASTIDSATDSEVFRVLVDRVLVLSVRPGIAVVMDNLAPHKAAGVAERIKRVGAELI